MLDTLTLLNKLNHTTDGLKVPYDTFHLNDLTEYVDVRIDYLHWLTDTSVSKLFHKSYIFILNVLYFSLIAFFSVTIHLFSMLKQRLNYYKLIKEYR